jgi:hypothetical protein
VNCNGREVTILKELVQFNASAHRANKDNHLVKLQRIQQVHQLAILLVFEQLNKVLLQAMKSQFGTIVDVDLQGLNKER